MSDYSNMILDSISTMVNQSVTEAPFDTTVQASIIECVDQNAGKYKVKYQDSMFYAYSQGEAQKYNKDTKVYVLVPSSDFSKTKRILGPVNESESNYVSIVAGSEDSYDKVGTDIIIDLQGAELKSYEKDARYPEKERYDEVVIYQKGSSQNLVKIEEALAREYFRKTEYFLFAAKFRTDLIEEQKSRGVYGVKIKLAFKIGEAGVSEEIVYKTYDFNSYDMTGQPYNFLLGSRQFKAFCYSGWKFDHVASIVFYREGFPSNEPLNPDLFISDLEMYAANPIPQEELDTYHITLRTPNGYTFEKDADKEKKIIATFKVNGKEVDSSTIDFYWFIEDRTVTDETNPFFVRKIGGVGWRCLNEYDDYENPTGGKPLREWRTKGKNEYTVFKNLIKTRNANIKCAVQYTPETVTTSYQEFINLDCQYSITIESEGVDVDENGVIRFKNESDVTNLICKVTPEELSNLVYIWGKTDAYGQDVPLSENENLRDYNYWVEYVRQAESYTTNNPEDFSIKENYPYYDEYKEKISAFSGETHADGPILYNVKAKDIDVLAKFSVTVAQQNPDGELTFIGTATITATYAKESGGYI